MASKKPAKPIAGQTKQPVQDPAIYGQPVKYYGFSGGGAMCAKCGNVTFRGMIRVKNEKNYCSVRCSTSS